MVLLLLLVLPGVACVAGVASVRHVAHGPRDHVRVSVYKCRSNYVK